MPILVSLFLLINVKVVLPYFLNLLTLESSLLLILETFLFHKKVALSHTASPDKTLSEEKGRMMHVTRKPLPHL